MKIYFLSKVSLDVTNLRKKRLNICNKVNQQEIKSAHVLTRDVTLELP